MGKQYRIAVLQQKGGAGKTTISTNLGRAFQLAGYSTLLVDSDPQGSARDWAGVRDDNPLSTIVLDRAGLLERDLKSVLNQDFVIIDGAPQVKDLAVAAIKSADLVLIPVTPSPYDVWATADLVELVKARIELTDGALKAAFVISRVIERTSVSKEIFSILTEFQLPVLRSRINQRVIFATSAGQGQSVMDAEPSGKAAAEIIALQREIVEFLNSPSNPSNNA